VPVDHRTEPWVDHGTEPVLDLSCQNDEAGRVLFTGESDDHLTVLPYADDRAMCELTVSR
jgi:hypothetical protein